MGRRTELYRLFVYSFLICLTRLYEPNFYKRDLPYVFYENSGNLVAGGPHALFFKLKKHIVAAATNISRDEQSYIVGGHCYFKLGSHSLAKIHFY